MTSTTQPAGEKNEQLAGAVLCRMIVTFAFYVFVVVVVFSPQKI